MSWKSHRTSKQNSFDIPGLPALVEENFERPVEPEQWKPAPARNRFDPIPLMAGWRARPEIDVDRAVTIDIGIGIFADAREFLAVAQHRTTLGIVQNHGPEILHRNLGWYVQVISLGAVEKFTLGVTGRPKILRAAADGFLHHRRRHADRGIGERRAAIGVDEALRREIGA